MVKYGKGDNPKRNVHLALFLLGQALPLVKYAKAGTPGGEGPHSF
jgi:hypothetical protein